MLSVFLYFLGIDQFNVYLQSLVIWGSRFYTMPPRGERDRLAEANVNRTLACLPVLSWGALHMQITLFAHLIYFPNPF